MVFGSYGELTEAAFKRMIKQKTSKIKRMAKFNERGGGSKEAFQDDDPERTKRIRESLKKDRERTADIAEKISPTIEGVRELLDNQKIITSLDEEKVSRLEKIKKVWEIEVAGKMRAYAKKGELGESRKNEATALLKEAQKIIRPIVEAKVYEITNGYGYNLNSEDENEAPESLVKLVVHLIYRVCDGSIKFEDIEKELEIEIGNLTKPTNLP